MAAERKERTIVLDKKKLIIGSIIGILLCVICAVFFSVKAGAVFFVGFVAVGAVRLNIHSDRWVRILRAVWLCTAIICTAEASQMIADGLEAEARSVYHLRHLNSLNTVGFKEMFAYFDGSITFDEAVEQIKRNTRRYAKKQLTWFSRDSSIRWFHPNNLSTSLSLP